MPREWARSMRPKASTTARGRNDKLPTPILPNWMAVHRFFRPMVPTAEPWWRTRRAFPMSEAKNLFPLLQQSADPGIVGAIEKLVRDAPDRDLCRVNVLDFAAKRGLDEEKSIASFLH